MKIFLLLTIISLNVNASITKIYNTKARKFISRFDLLNSLPNDGFILLGEYHNNEAIQLAESEIIETKVITSGRENNFKVMWEFLNTTEQEKINSLFNDVKTSQMTVAEFINKTAGSQNLIYSSVIEATKKFNGDLIGLNLPREIKSKVMNDGISSIDPKLVPPNHYVGGDDYLARFSEAMGGHAPRETLEKYFLAQCLTDSVMSFTANQNKGTLNFIVAGSFHTDFYDATTIRLKKLTTDPVVTLKIVNDRDLSREDRDSLLTGDKRYGEYADFVVFAE